MKKMLFIQGGSRWKFDTIGNIYTDSNFNEAIWNRYRSYCDYLTVILRRERNIYEFYEAQEKFNIFRKDKSDCVALPDIYRPVYNFMNFSYRQLIKRVIDEEVQKTDFIVIRLSSGEIYTSTAVRCAKKHNKPYLVEVCGFAFESLWYHSLRGKLTAYPKELHMRYIVKNAPYAVYVTDKLLQKRYPCSGESIGCSDVELPELNNNILNMRFEKIQKHFGKKLVLGTAAWLDVKLKGQESVIRALAELKNHGITKIEYWLAGGGEGRKLQKLGQKLGLEDEIRIMGTLPHNQVFEWLDEIDIYIQPSFYEGLSRSIIEAMGRACPVLAGDVGGNSELVSGECLFSPGNISEIAHKIMWLSDLHTQTEQAKRNFDVAKNYLKADLDNKRDLFYNKFVRKAEEQ